MADREDLQTPFDRQRAVSLLEEATQFLREYSGAIAVSTQSHSGENSEIQPAGSCRNEPRWTAQQPKITGESHKVFSHNNNSFECIYTPEQKRKRRSWIFKDLLGTTIWSLSAKQTNSLVQVPLLKKNALRFLCLLADGDCTLDELVDDVSRPWGEKRLRKLSSTLPFAALVRAKLSLRMLSLFPCLLWCVNTLEAIVVVWGNLVWFARNLWLLCGSFRRDPAGWISEFSPLRLWVDTALLPEYSLKNWVASSSKETTL